MRFRCGACGSDVTGDAIACPSCSFKFGVFPASVIQQPSEGTFTGTGHFLAYTLLVLAIPAFLESAYEMYGLTLVRGEQMLFFSITHTGGAFVLALLLFSWVCFTALIIYSGSITALRFFSVRSCKDTFGRIFTVVFAVTLSHMILLATYGYWAGLL
jgi:hypothetical protein